MAPMRQSSKVVEARQCPECAKHGRDRSEDNLKIYDDGHGYCYGCATYFPSEEKELFVTEDFSYEYLAHRGISKNTFARYGVKTKIDSNGKPVAVGFTYPNGACQVREFGTKEMWWERNGKEVSKAGLFGMDKFSSGSHKYVTITEGAYDALAMYETLGGPNGSPPCVSVQSAVTAHRDCVVARDWLAGFERIYLCFDADDPGREAAANVAKLFDYNKVFYVKLTRFKDANDYLKNSASDELRQIWNNSKQYQPDGILSTFSEFEAALDKNPSDGWKIYPSQTLNEMTYGVRTSESVLITAPEGVGKTELMHAIEYNALKELGNDVKVGSIFLEEPKGRHLQALAGIHLQGPAHLPDAGIARSEISSALKEVIREDGRFHLYSHFGSDDPRVIEDTIRFLVSSVGCRIILLDHITMVVSALAGEDERKALDYLSTRLEMMVKELDFALILVSHVNDDGKTRGSRLISKNCDVRIDMYRDTMALDPVERNTTYLSVPKNRPIGKTGPAGKIVFDVYSQTYTEPANENNPSSEQRQAA